MGCGVLCGCEPRALKESKNFPQPPGRGRCLTMASPEKPPGPLQARIPSSTLRKRRCGWARAGAQAEFHRKTQKQEYCAGLEGQAFFISPWAGLGKWEWLVFSLLGEPGAEWPVDHGHPKCGGTIRGGGGNNDWISPQIVHSPPSNPHPLCKGRQAESQARKVFLTLILKMQVLTAREDFCLDKMLGRKSCRTAEQEAEESWVSREIKKDSLR